MTYSVFKSDTEYTVSVKRRKPVTFVKDGWLGRNKITINDGKKKCQLNWKTETLPRQTYN